MLESHKPSFVSLKDLIERCVYRIQAVPRAPDVYRPSINCMRRIIRELEEPVDILNSIQDPGPWTWLLMDNIFEKFDFFSQTVWLKYHGDLNEQEAENFSIGLADALDFWRILCDDYEARGLEKDVELINEMLDEEIDDLRSSL